MDSFVNAILEDTTSKGPFKQPILELFSDLAVQSTISPSNISLVNEDQQQATFTSDEKVSFCVRSLSPSILQVKITNTSESEYKSWRYKIKILAYL